MVAEERITTKFSGLVGAYGSEEEATFLATQQVDEARHMQFYARFQDEVVADQAAIAAHVERAREQISPAFRLIFDEALVEAHEQLVANPRDAEAKVRFVTALPPGPRGDPRPDLVQLRHRLPGAGGAAAGIRRRLLEDPPRRAAPHRLRHLVPAGGGRRGRPRSPTSCARRCASCCRRSPSRSRRPTGRGPTGTLSERRRGDPRLRARRPDATAEHHRRAPLEPLTGRFA